MTVLTLYAKAIVGALIAALGALTTSMDVVPPWVSVTSTALGALGLVWAVPNAKPAP